ncbi:hypothetical protein [Methylobacterium sp. ID0610]|uniref:hypothetical protein n=1 Tax=Methylobacterium carpenticola TaxID=3344827 RepID=UPI0036ABB3D2
MIEPTADPTQLDILAREIHEITRLNIQSCPAWEDLDLSDTYERAFRDLAYARARDLIAMSEMGEH